MLPLPPLVLAPALLALALILLPSTLAGARPSTYIIQQDETLGHIAIRHGCSVKELMAANRETLKAPEKIWPGQQLRIPTCAGKPSSRRGGAATATSCNWSPDDFQTKTLRKKMLAAGFKPPKRFRAMVVETHLSRDQRRVRRHRILSFGRLAWEHMGWNPASTVKIYSAIGALEQLRRHGFGVSTRVTFHYKKGDLTFPLEQLFEQAVHQSKNIPHNRLTQLAGFDFLNGPGGTFRRAGLDHTFIMRAYALDEWKAQGQSRWLRDSPAITLKEGRRKKRLPARRGKGRHPCQGAACTSLSDLAKTMCRMMLHEQLPKRRRLRLGGASQSPHLRLLRQSMDAKRKGRTDRVWDAFEEAFPPDQGYKLFRKAGFAREWLSENIYIYNPKQSTRWIVTMAGYPGRGSLTGAAKIIARLIKGGDLSLAR